PDGTKTQPYQDLLRPLAYPPQRRDGQRMEEGDDVTPRDHEQTVGLAPRRGQLRHELRRGDTDGAGDVLLVRDAVTDELGDRRRRPEAPDSARDVEEGLVEGERLHQRR